MGMKEIKHWDEMSMGEMKNLQQEMETLKYVADKATAMLETALDKNKLYEAHISELNIIIADQASEIDCLEREVVDLNRRSIND